MSEPDHRIVVPLSKFKVGLVLLGSSAFVVLSVLLWPAIDLIPRRNVSYVWMASALGASAAFFGVCGLYALRKLFDTAPGLVIDDEGIVDNSSGISAGRIPWSEIIGVHVKTVQRQRFLTIEVRDPQKYVQRASFLKRGFVSLNARYFGGPIQISASVLKINFDELHSMISRAFDKSRQA